MVSARSLMSVWAALLTSARVQQGMSQRRLAAQAGVTQGQISSWESGAETSVPNLIRWADSLGFDVALIQRREADL